MESKIIQASAKDFILQNINPKTIGKAKGYIVLVKANWCPHCIMYEPSFERQSLLNNSYKFIIVEQTKNEQLLTQWKELISPAFEVQGYPTLLSFDSKGKFKEFIEDRDHIDKYM